MSAIAPITCCGSADFGDPMLMLKHLTFAAALLAVTTAVPAQATHQAHKPAAKEAAPGGGPDKVWVNTNSSVYHCYGDRYYGKTAHGRYMTEAQAKAAGAHGVGGKNCAAK